MSNPESRAPLPTAMLIGPGRTGTTSLFEYLARHPDVAATREKETQIFRPAILGGPVDTGAYEAQLCGTSGKVHRLEGTPSYFQGGASLAAKILEECGPISIVTTLRDPAARLVSNFFHLRDKHLHDRSYSFESYATELLRVHREGFRDEKDFAFGGLVECDYATHLGQWVGVFGDGKLLVCFLENIVTDATPTLNNLLAYLSLQSPPTGDIVRTNASHGIRSHSVHRGILSVARRFAAPLRRHPELKRAMQRIYYGLNSSPYTPETSAVARQAEELIRNTLEFRELPRILQRCKVAGPIPRWVDSWARL